MPWQKKVAREWLIFIGIALLSLPLSLPLGYILDEADIYDVSYLRDLGPIVLVIIFFIYCFRLTVWSIKQVRHKEN